MQRTFRRRRKNEHKVNLFFSVPSIIFFFFLSSSRFASKSPFNIIRMKLHYSHVEFHFYIYFRLILQNLFIFSSSFLLFLSSIGFYFNYLLNMVDYKTWLKDIDNNTRISKLSIPGTHNSAACHTALPSVQCQGASVTEQLEHGVRFLDIRVGKLFVGNDVKDLQVIHGKFPVKILSH